MVCGKGEMVRWNKSKRKKKTFAHFHSFHYVGCRNFSLLYSLHDNKNCFMTFLNFYAQKSDFSVEKCIFEDENSFLTRNEKIPVGKFCTKRRKKNERERSKRTQCFSKSDFISTSLNSQLSISLWLCLCFLDARDVSAVRDEEIIHSFILLRQRYALMSHKHFDVLMAFPYA